MSDKNEKLPIDLVEKVKVAKKMMREELGLPDSEVRFGMSLTANGISLTHRSAPGIVIDYTWKEVELEAAFPES